MKGNRADSDSKLRSILQEHNEGEALRLIRRGRRHVLRRQSGPQMAHGRLNSSLTPGIRPIDLQHIHLLCVLPSTRCHPVPAGLRTASSLDHRALWHRLLSLLCIRNGRLVGLTLFVHLHLGIPGKPALPPCLPLVPRWHPAECATAGNLQVLELFYWFVLSAPPESPALGRRVSPAGHLIFYIRVLPLCLGPPRWKDGGRNAGRVSCIHPVLPDARRGTDQAISGLSAQTSRQSSRLESRLGTRHHSDSHRPSEEVCHC
jgi:hypothetical protein